MGSASSTPRSRPVVPGTSRGRDRPCRLLPNKALELTAFSVLERGHFSCSFCYCCPYQHRWRQLSLSVGPHFVQGNRVTFFCDFCHCIPTSTRIFDENQDIFPTSTHVRTTIVKYFWYMKGQNSRLWEKVSKNVLFLRLKWGTRPNCDAIALALRANYALIFLCLYL